MKHDSFLEPILSSAIRDRGRLVFTMAAQCSEGRANYGDQAPPTAHSRRALRPAGSVTQQRQVGTVRHVSMLFPLQWELYLNGCPFWQRPPMQAVVTQRMGWWRTAGGRVCSCMRARSQRRNTVCVSGSGRTLSLMMPARDRAVYCVGCVQQARRLPLRGFGARSSPYSATY